MNEFKRNIWALESFEGYYTPDRFYGVFEALKGFVKVNWVALVLFVLGLMIK